MTETREMMADLLRSRGCVERMPAEAEARDHDEKQRKRLTGVVRGVDHSTEFRLLVGVWLDARTGRLNLVESLGGDQVSAGFLDLPIEYLMLVSTEELAGLKRMHAGMAKCRIYLPYRMEFCIWLRTETDLGEELFRGAWLRGLRYAYSEGDCWSLWFDGLVLRRHADKCEEIST